MKFRTEGSKSLKLKQRFHDSIVQLLHTFPLDHAWGLIGGTLERFTGQIPESLYKR